MKYHSVRKTKEKIAVASSRSTDFISEGGGLITERSHPSASTFCGLSTTFVVLQKSISFHSCLSHKYFYAPSVAEEMCSERAVPIPARDCYVVVIQVAS